jgi:PPM family protein phosphatase
VNNPLRWVGFGRTETGLVRRSNQDAFAADNSLNLWVVADGMGGHPSSDLAARTAVEVAARQAREQFPTLEHTAKATADFVAGLVIAANRAIHEKVRAQPSLRGMGTTMVAMTITPTPSPVAHIAHLGDSRAYRFHKGELTQLTNDHTLVSVLLERGLINAATARAYPDRHVLAKGLGMGLDMKPELTSTPLTSDDVLVLCSDGLTKMLDDKDIASVLSRTAGNPRRACDDLIEQALTRGGEDNVTVIVCAHATPNKA